MSRPTGAQIARRRFLVFGGLGLATVAVGGSVIKACSGDSGGTTSAVVRVTEPERIDPPILAGAEAPPPADAVFDTVISGGRVMDPASGYDAVANVGLLGERIALISTEPLTGKSTIDATGKVVAPGFIDLLSYEPNPYGVWYKLGDGVTTNLGMHGIKTPVDASEFLAGYEGDNAPPLHFGGAFSDQWYRDSVGVKGTASASQISRLTDDFNAQLDEGFIGIAIDPEYAPSIDVEEFLGLATAAQQAGMPLFSHIRYSAPEPAGQSSLDAIDEVLGVARETGVSLHVDHIPSMATHVMPEAMAKLEAARSEGLDVTALLLPVHVLGHLPGLEPLQRRLAEPLPDHLLRPPAGRVLRAAHRVLVPQVPAAEQARRRLRHPPGGRQRRGPGPVDDDRLRRDP